MLVSVYGMSLCTNPSQMIVYFNRLLRWSGGALEAMALDAGGTISDAAIIARGLVTLMPTVLKRRLLAPEQATSSSLTPLPGHAVGILRR